jgi:hypothetical protein
VTGVNPFVVSVGVLQIIGGLWSACHADWKMATINVAVGVANSVLGTMAK